MWPIAATRSSKSSNDKDEQALLPLSGDLEFSGEELHRKASDCRGAFLCFLPACVAGALGFAAGILWKDQSPSLSCVYMDCRFRLNFYHRHQARLAMALGDLHAPRLDIYLPLNPYSAPILHDIDFQLSTKTFNGSFFNQTPFRQPAGVIVDAAWESLGVDCKAGVMSTRLLTDNI